MESAMDLVSFVTRAENRVTVLLTLRSGSATRPNLQSATEIPRATLSRILADMQDRALIDRNSHEYTMTPLGNLIADELATLFESVESMRALQRLAQWLPLDDIGVSFSRFAEAEVTLPEPVDPMRPAKRAATVVEGANQVQTFCYSVVHAPILAALKEARRNDQRLEGVIATGVLEVIAADPDLSARVRELFETGTADVYLYDKGIQPQLLIADTSTVFLVTDDEGAIQGLVETTDERILAWSRDRFQSIKQQAKPLTLESVSELLTS